MTQNPADTAPRIRPVGQRKTVQDQVYDQLRDALIAGAFEAGESFTIAALAERFHTSHMPVREALRRLAAENALRISTTGTAFVPAITQDELEDITRTRVIVECATAELAAARLDVQDIAILEQLNERHIRAGLGGAMAEMVDTNRAFHFHIYERAGSPVLTSVIGNLWLRLGPYVRFLSDRMGATAAAQTPDTFSRHHRSMLDALRSRDVPAFRRAMEDDIRGTSSLLIQFILEDQAAG